MIYSMARCPPDIRHDLLIAHVYWVGSAVVCRYCTQREVQVQIIYRSSTRSTVYHDHNLFEVTDFADITVGVTSKNLGGDQSRCVGS